MDRSATAARAVVGASPGFARIAFVCTALLGGALFWVVARPPMGDLPQHAGQVALLHDLLTGTSRWSDTVYINFFTPYLLAFSLATALSFLVPVLTALKLVLTAAYLAFVAVAVALRKEFGGDERLDWLFIPGFFGFSFQYGFFTFLVAAPIGLLFLLMARRFAANPTRAAAARVVAAGVVLFFSHGLAFVFCVGIGFGMALLVLKRATAVRALLPYAVLGGVGLAYFVFARLHNPLLAHGDAPIDWEWNHPWGWHRVPAFLIYVMASTSRDVVFFPAMLLLVAAPWLLGARLSTDRVKLVPIAAVLAFWLLVPGEIARTTYLYHRFAVFLLPAYVLAFRPAQATPPRRSVAVQAGLALLCWWFLGTIALRERAFARESASFESVLDAAEPGQRAMGIVPDPHSEAAHHEWAYHSYHLYYQAERQGFVDFNFALLVPEIVRFRPGRAPPMTANVEAFHWHEYNASIYRYFFVRHTGPLQTDMFDNDQCRVELVRDVGQWALYERRECSY